MSGLKVLAQNLLGMLIQDQHNTELKKKTLECTRRVCRLSVKKS